MSSCIADGCWIRDLNTAGISILFAYEAGRVALII
jgi:hypothetical protein